MLRLECAKVWLVNRDSPKRSDPGTADADDAENADRRGSPLAKADIGALLHREITDTILGAFYSVYSELGCGFLEAVYTNALVVTLQGAGLRANRQVPFDIHFRGRLIGHYRADLVVAKRVVVEVKAGRVIVPQHSAQLLNYLKASGLTVGILLHFGEKPDFRRVVLTRSDPR